MMENMMTRLLDTKQTSHQLNIAEGTLENWRTKGLGPRFIKTPGRRGKVLYDPVDLAAWKEANSFQSTSEAA